MQICLILRVHQYQLTTGDTAFSMHSSNNQCCGVLFQIYELIVASEKDRCMGWCRCRDYKGMLQWPAVHLFITQTHL